MLAVSLRRDIQHIHLCERRAPGWYPSPKKINHGLVANLLAALFNNTRTELIVLLLGDPHLVEGAQAT